MHLPVASQDSRKICYVIPAGYYNWGINPLACWSSKFSNNQLWYITLVFPQKKKKKRVKLTDQRTASSPLVGYISWKPSKFFQSFERARDWQFFDSKFLYWLWFLDSGFVQRRNRRFLKSSRNRPSLVKPTSKRFTHHEAANCMVLWT